MYSNRNVSRGYARPVRPSRLPRKRSSRSRTIAVVVVLLLVVLFIGFKLFGPTSVEQAINRLQFDDSVTAAEQQSIRDAIQNQSKTYRGSVTVSAQTDTTSSDSRSLLNVYVPVTDAYAVRQDVTKAELQETEVYVPSDTDDTVRRAIAGALDMDSERIKSLESPISELTEDSIAFIPVDQLSASVKLLSFEGQYYLDSFASGAVFRQAIYDGRGADDIRDLQIHDYASRDTVLKTHMTGVTALTREMMHKLQTVGGNGAYFSEKIAPFLSDADVVHTSNEVSFRDGCAYSTTLFCSPPEMLEALKASGINLIELTGNHNNDVGRQYNTDTINLYHGLGWGTFGGGLNEAEAAKPHIADQKGSKVAFLGYNYADSPGSGALATADDAGANGWSAEKAQADIAAAKQSADFVIVTVQFWECYAYPEGYLEFPECDIPIGQQAEVFRQIASFGADMVVGTSAHQPQTYELYNGTPIYYGLGNLFFDQTRWPGTERGIILTHYFAGGKLLQTRLTPTVYDRDLQPRLMTGEETQYLLQRLQTARGTAGL